VNRIATQSFIVMLVLACLPVPDAQARGSVAIVNHENIAIATGSARTPTVDEVAAAITRAGQTISYPWTVTSSEPGHVVLSTLVRNKHTVVVDVQFTASSYSVTYRDSVNMNYKLDKDVPKIHPNYNVWVEQLIAAINAELHKL
jgi:hypothetical protein